MFAPRIRPTFVGSHSFVFPSILWKLIEKKFQDLGEFVEGKEKLKMVVHKVYKNTKELTSMFEADLGSFEDDDAEDFPEDMNEFIFGEDLEQDILSLGEEEKKMVKEDEGEDDESEDDRRK